MRNNWKRYILVLIIAALLYSLLTFILPFERNAVFYIAYGCAMLLILAQLLVAWRAFGDRQKAASFIYGIPMVRVGWILAAVQLAGGIVLMLLARLLPVLYAVLAEGIFLGTATILLVINDAQKETLTSQDERLKERTQTMHQLQAYAEQMVEENQQLLPMLRKLSREMRFSDPVSSEATAQGEEMLKQSMEDLKAALDNENEQQAAAACREALRVLSERNRICRQNK